MLTDDIREKFRQIKIFGERNARFHEEKNLSDLSVIGYMKYLLESHENDFFDTGFCLWNISDSYALMRDGENLFENHRYFADFLSDKPGKYSSWAVSDATQRFTLISFGYENFWHEMYQNAMENSEITTENYRCVYEAHRAAMAIHPILKIPEEHLIYADKKFSEFIQNNKNVKEYNFYRVIYISSCIKAFGQKDTDVESLCYDFFPKFKLDDVPSEFVCGEWEHLNRVRSEKNQANVGITSAVNALINVGEIKRATELYFTAKEYGLPDNMYINKRLE